VTKLSESQTFNGCLDAVCSEIEDWGLEPDQQVALTRQILDELAGRRELAAEQAHAIAYDPERQAAANEAYRRNMIAAGRGNQLR
jgi:hypothetical protein